MIVTVRVEAADVAKWCYNDMSFFGQILEEIWGYNDIYKDKFPGSGHLNAKLEKILELCGEHRKILKTFSDAANGGV